MSIEKSKQDLIPNVRDSVLLGEKYADVEPIISFAYSSTEKKNKIKTINFSDLKNDRTVSLVSSSNKSANLSQVKELLDQVADLITQSSKDAGKFFANMPDILLEIFERIENLSEILNLTDEQQKEMLSEIINIIFDNIKLNIKIKGIKLPDSLVRAMIKPIVLSIAMSILNWIEKIAKKPRIISSIKTKTV